MQWIILLIYDLYLCRLLCYNLIYTQCLYQNIFVKYATIWTVYFIIFYIKIKSMDDLYYIAYKVPLTLDIAKCFSQCNLTIFFR